MALPMRAHLPRALSLIIGYMAIGMALASAMQQPLAHEGPAIAPLTLPPLNPGEPEIFIPKGLGGMPADADFNDPASEFSFMRGKSSPHFIIMWAKGYGSNPIANREPDRRFDPDEVLKAAELSYDVFFNRLKWAPTKEAMARRYKMVILVTISKNGTAYGGSVDNKIGALWTPAGRISKGPYCIIAHELGHSFQALSRADGAVRFENIAAFGEMSSQFMLWQVYPDWQKLENYHLKAFMKATHLAFLHRDNEYHSCYPLEYWSFRHGPEIIGRIWREAKKDEDPVMAYQRITKIDQKRFNDEMFDASRRFVTWDLPRIEALAAPYANQHFTSLNTSGDGIYRIAAEKAPQNYGYNAIKLNVPKSGSRVRVAFKGTAGLKGSSEINVDKAGWRYGFVAHLTDGTRKYSSVFSSREGIAEFQVPANTKFLWFVVMGAPTAHWIHNLKKLDAEAWPYEFKIQGTTPDAAMIAGAKNG